MKINSKILIHLSIAFLIISIYCLIINNNQIFELITYLLTFILLTLSIINRKNISITLKKEPIDRYISLIGLEIALLAFIQTSFQVEKNNKQFEENRIASDKLFQTQLKHAENLNQLQIKNAQILNDSLISELNKIQDINKQQSLAAENQLLSSQQQFELSKQSLSDYLADTKPDLTLGKTEIVSRDTINDNKIKLSIIKFFTNTGKREALNVEIRNAIIHNNRGVSDVLINTDMSLFTANSSAESNFYPEMLLSESEDFFYWFQVIYYDKRLDKYTDRSYYFHYYKSVKGFDFYYVNDIQKKAIQKIVDSELKRKGLSLISN